MTQSNQIAHQLRTLLQGNNWTGVSINELLAGVSWVDATYRLRELHSIATLVFHLDYYIEATVRVLRGQTLDASDKFSFDCPPIESDDDWRHLLQKTRDDIEQLANLVERLPDRCLSEVFVEERYGTYHRCLQGPIEHCYYHLGQIAIIKTLIEERDE